MPSMKDLYEEMKAALKYLGLSFGEMHKAVTTLKDNEIAFSYGGRTVTIDLEDHSL